MNKTLVIASRNGHKIREIRSFLRVLPQYDIYSLLDFPNYTPPEECGSTFEENALLKATHAAQALGKWVLSDDSGLVVPALSGAPGIHSARYAGEEASDKENQKKLLLDMEGLEGIRRSAYLECCLVLANPEQVVKVIQGICEGEIVDKPHGSNGFGYDSLFVKHDYKKTFGQIEESIKNQISHRAKALEKIRLSMELNPIGS